MKYIYLYIGKVPTNDALAISRIVQKKVSQKWPLKIPVVDRRSPLSMPMTYIHKFTSSHKSPG